MTISEQTLFQYNALDVLAQLNLPNYPIQSNLTYSMFAAPYYNWKLGERYLMKRVIDSSDYIPQLRQSFVINLSVSCAAFFGFSMIYAVMLTMNIGTFNFTVFVGQDDKTSHHRRLRRFFKYAFKVLQFPFYVWSFWTTHQLYSAFIWGSMTK